jgi:hypothetical protein
MRFPTWVAVSAIFLLTKPVASSAQTLDGLKQLQKQQQEEAAGGKDVTGGGSKVPLEPAAAAPQTSVTFNVPLNLSQLEPELTSVAVMCEVRSAALLGVSSASGLTSVSPGNGRVFTTAAVVVPIPRLDDPTGKSATYVCRLFGLRTTGTTLADKLKESQTTNWELFSAGAAVTALRLTPDPAAIAGSFDWVESAPTASAPPNVTTTSPGGNP